MNPKPLKKTIYNPLSEDFTVNFAGDENIPVPYTIHALEVDTYPTVIANHITKHLAEHIYQIRGQKTNHDDDIKAIRREIEEVEI